MKTSASLDWASDAITATRNDGGRVGIAQREVITLDFTKVHPVPDCAHSLTDFLDEFEASPDVAVHVEAARREVAKSYQEKGHKVRLSHLRLAAGLSQTELGDMIGTSQSNVSMLERRLQKPGEDTIRALASALNVDFNTLLDALNNE